MDAPKRLLAEKILAGLRYKAFEATFNATQNRQECNRAEEKITKVIFGVVQGAGDKAAKALRQGQSQNLLSGSQQEGRTYNLESLVEEPLELDDYIDEIPVAATSKRKRKSAEVFQIRGKDSFTRRFQSLSTKWQLKSGTIVEDTLFQAGINCRTYLPIHSFIIDLDDPWMESLFSAEDWQEICEDLPRPAPYSKIASKYLESFEDVSCLEGLRNALKIRPNDYESWGSLGGSDMLGAYAATLQTEVDSSNRRNRGRNAESMDARRRMGVRADIIWRTMETPVKDWAKGEAATEWNPTSNKYINEDAFKLPRQLHDILASRTLEIGGADPLRDELVTGLLIDGPVIERVAICWGTAGENVTRIIRGKGRRINSSIKNLCGSLSCIHECATIRLIRSYKESKRTQGKKLEQLARRGDLIASKLSPKQKARHYNLLHSSP
ncbi:hypothetical protein BGX27_007151 [Mortierella sp. AM989]|nr:hypothetical protein BGX27_007151 [Mortierella sp. AM989]